MFRELINEARISLLLHTESPLSIRSAQGKLLNPTLPDMQCIKSCRNGQDMAIIPGSSLKGVIRSRYEKIVKLFGGRCCDILDNTKCCHKPKDWKEKAYTEQGKYVYQKMCPACKLFGSGAIASRIFIADAYPVGKCIMGERTGVAINRITGGAQKGALYDYEVVEDGVFRVEITLKNYELYQMKLLMFVLKDMDEGYVSLGAATTRGNGRMKVEKLEICLREYRRNVRGWKGAIDEQEIPLDPTDGKEYDWSQPFFGELKLQEITVDEMIKKSEDVEIEKYVRYPER